RVGLHIDLFEDCSAFTRVAACTLARSPIRDPLSEGFRHFVTSMPAPVASGWSGCRVGLAPTGKRRLVTAHPHSGHLPDVQRVCRPPAADAGGGDRRLPRAGTESQESSRSGTLARPSRAPAARTRGCAPANEGAREWHT